MKVKNLGRITELPQVPKGTGLELLIVSTNKEHNQFYSSRMGGTFFWYAKATTKSEYTKEDFKNGFPNGAEAILITF